ncbi:hypothetical protein D3C75_756800 [compost metagenome]
MVIGADVLLPERRQMDLFRVEIVAPVVGFIACQTIAGNGMGDRVNVVALCGQRQPGRRQGSGTRQQFVAQVVLLVEVILDSCPLWRGQFAVVRFDERQDTCQGWLGAEFKPQVEASSDQAG